MTDWDLLMPGIGLTSIGIVGVLVSLSGIAKTFLDGMHAVSLLLFLIGMIFLSAGLFKDGFPSSRKAKISSFITLGILIIIGLIGAISSSGQTPTIFAYIGIIVLISIPAIFVIVGIYRNSQKVKIYISSFVAAVIIGIISISAIGIQIQNQGSLAAENNEGTMTPEPISNININELSKVNILAGSAAQGNPDYDPDELIVKDSIGIIWFNQDNVPHTVTSLKDDGKSFDSSIIMGNANYTLLLSELPDKEYEYFCTIHPYMTAKFRIE